MKILSSYQDAVMTRVVRDSVWMPLKKTASRFDWIVDRFLRAISTTYATARRKLHDKQESIKVKNELLAFYAKDFNGLMLKQEHEDNIRNQPKPTTTSKTNPKRRVRKQVKDDSEGFSKQEIGQTPEVFSQVSTPKKRKWAEHEKNLNNFQNLKYTSSKNPQPKQPLVVNKEEPRPSLQRNSSDRDLTPVELGIPCVLAEFDTD